MSTDRNSRKERQGARGRALEARRGLGGHVQVNLRAGDQPMAQQVSDGHQIHARLHQVRGERVPVMPSAA